MAMAGAGIPDDGELKQFETLAQKFHDQMEALQKEFAKGDGIDPGEAQVLDRLAAELRKIRTMMASVKSAVASKKFETTEAANAAEGGAPGGGGGGADGGEFTGNTVGGAPPPGANTGGAGGAVPKEIKDSVGQGGKNQPDDVKAVQALLNKQGEKLPVDGKSSPQLIAAITKFQKAKLHFGDGRIDPGGKTWAALSGGK
jgi:Putative peptidoglycan binding domain